MNSERSPTGPNLEQVIAGSEIELLTEPIDLGDARPSQTLFGGLEDSRGVRHRFVEEQPEEVIAEVVVRPDVPPAPGE